jgi:dUTP pyrophosphatase
MLKAEVQFQRLTDRAALPAYKSDLAAGMDVAACLPEDHAQITLDPVHRGGAIIVVKTGFAMAIPAGFEAQVRPRSGLASKHGVTLPNAPGTIDADYRGEVMIPLINLGPEPVTITHGMRIAQMIIAPVAHATLVEVHELDGTGRGAGGFGSTGTH